MDIKEAILDALTKDDIIDLMTSFGVGHKQSNGDLVFQSHCHGSDKYKLYYYERDNDGNTHDDEDRSCKHFMCYSNCGGMSIFNTFMEINNWDFKECLEFLADYKGISVKTKKEKTFGAAKQVIEDWDFIEKYRRLDKVRDRVEPRRLPVVDKKVLNVFDNIYPSSWEDEGITLEAMQKFGICFHTMQWKAVIPHYDIWGNLIGIRGRSFLKRDLDNGVKYSPIYVENEGYRHPIQYNLYGIHENLEIIKKTKKVILFEGEKAVLLCESYFPNENFSVALCGTSFSNYQRDLLINETSVEEVIIALDRQFKMELITEKDHEEYDSYIKKIKKIADKLVNYVNVYVVYCDDERLNYKDAPCDNGKEVLMELMSEKERYYNNE